VVPQEVSRQTEAHAAAGQGGGHLQGVPHSAGGGAGQAGERGQAEAVGALAVQREDGVGVVARAAVQSGVAAEFCGLEKLVYYAAGAEGGEKAVFEVGVEFSDAVSGSDEPSTVEWDCLW
jgi:hypothetical protein